MAKASLVRSGLRREVKAALPFGAVVAVVSQGATRQEALANIRDAIARYLESLRQPDEPIPPPIWEETVEIDA